METFALKIQFYASNEKNIHLWILHKKSSDEAPCLWRQWSEFKATTKFKRSPPHRHLLTRAFPSYYQPAISTSILQHDLGTKSLSTSKSALISTSNLRWHLDENQKVHSPSYLTTILTVALISPTQTTAISNPREEDSALPQNKENALHQSQSRVRGRGLSVLNGPKVRFPKITSRSLYFLLSILHPNQSPNPGPSHQTKHELTAALP